MAGGAATPNIAALPAIARLGACKSARGPDADRRVKLLIQPAVVGAHSGAYSHAPAYPVVNIEKLARHGRSIASPLHCDGIAVRAISAG
jgi:hypothetical protein